MANPDLIRNDERPADDSDSVVEIVGAAEMTDAQIAALAAFLLSMDDDEDSET